MSSRPRVRDSGIIIGKLKPGQRNSISDVPGVIVGHVSLIRGEGKLVPGQGPVRTGVTAILPHNRNLFMEKVPAAAYVINGYGKSIGLVQIEELGTLETPILLTNTLNVPRVADGVIDYMLQQNPSIGISTSTVNPVVCECNDGDLNDIQGRHVMPQDAVKAINIASVNVEEGNVGAGVGMSCFEFKGGIGTASRIVDNFIIGCLVLTNFGNKEDLMVNGIPIGKQLVHEEKHVDTTGSVITILATNTPLGAKKLERLAKRVPFGLARVGSYGNHGSGDIVIAFSTSNEVLFPDTKMNALFRAVIESVEEAILNSLFKAETLMGRDNHVREALPVELIISHQ